MLKRPDVAAIYRSVGLTVEKALPPAMVSGEPEKKSKPSAEDQKKVQAVLDDKTLPEKAEAGKAYVIHWADGRGVFAVKTKKAIKDWLAETGSWAEIVSIKYGPAEHKGKKLRVEDVIPVLPLLTEAQFQVNSDNLDKTYNAFKDSYEKRTGKAWSKDKFAQRVGGWTMYGDHDGFVSARQQASGPIKLVGSAGSLQGVKKGFQELLATGKPVWGMMDDKLAALSTRFGMVRPSPWVMKMVFKRILPKVAPALGVPVDKVAVNNDGSLTIDYPDVGKATKFLVGNKEYFDWLLKTHGDAIPAMVRTAIAHFLVTGAHPAKPAGMQED